MDPAGRPDDHRTFEDMAVAHVMGGLDQEDGRVFRAHLLECGDCRARVGELRAIASELATVERDERRVRSAQTVEMKSRESDSGEADLPPRRPPGWVSRVLTFAGLAALLVLVAYVFTLRGQVTNLERERDLRLEASAALEHGEPLSIIHTAPGVTDATVKRHGDEVVVLLEGLEDEVYGLYLVDDSGASSQTVYREPRRPEDGRLFVLFTLQGTEDLFIVTLQSNGVGADPSGMTIFEAHLDRYAED